MMIGVDFINPTLVELDEAKAIIAKSFTVPRQWLHKPMEIKFRGPKYQGVIRVSINLHEPIEPNAVQTIIETAKKIAENIGVRRLEVKRIKLVAEDIYVTDTNIVKPIDEGSLKDAIADLERAVEDGSMERVNVALASIRSIAEILVNSRTLVGSAE